MKTIVSIIDIQEETGMSILGIMFLIMFGCLCNLVVIGIIITMNHKYKIEEIERTKELERNTYNGLYENSMKQAEEWLGKWGQ